jgi:hypothetical protein
MGGGGDGDGADQTTGAPSTATPRTATRGPGASQGSGVPQGTLGSQLSAEQALKFCDWTQSVTVGPTREQWCTYEASFEFEEAASCQALRDECIADPSLVIVPGTALPEADRLACGENLLEVLEGCDATVKELEDCARAEIFAEADVIVSATCGAPPPPASPAGAACEPLYTKCPWLSSSDDGSDGGYVCDDGSDIPGDWVCDGFDDCDGGEDEASCP